jgi:hypothetical protein
MILYLLRLSIASLLCGLVLLLGEPNAEKPQKISISGPDIDESLNQSLPLLDHGSELVRGQAHTIELGQAVLALDIIDDQLELAKGPLSILENELE